MFQRLMLRLMGQEQKPPDPFKGDFGGTAYHVDTLPKRVRLNLDRPPPRSDANRPTAAKA